MSRAQTRALLRATKREALAFKCDEVADESEERAYWYLKVQAGLALALFHSPCKKDFDQDR